MKYVGNYYVGICGNRRGSIFSRKEKTNNINNHHYPPFQGNPGDSSQASFFDGGNDCGSSFDSGGSCGGE